MLLEELVLPLKTDSTAFKAGIAAAAAGVAALVAGMGLAIKATFKWADELDSIQDIMGVTNKTAAALNFTLRKSGTSTEALTKGMTILSKGLIKADGSLDTTGKSLKAWGINVLDANGILKDQTSLIGEISDKYSTFATQQEKVNFLTETFGRSGAELIDFFDTLAADGGIDAVAAKVERLGLAIDPNRYEQFNRNLEELKLVGLGLAVAFTEKVMPIIEKFLELVSDPKGIDLSKIATWADTTIAKFVKGLGDSINNWVASGGPEDLSESLVGWIEGIGEGEAVKSKIQIAMEHLVTAMGNALREIDWSAITTAMGEKIQELFEANQPVGENSVRDFWNGLEVAGTDAVRNWFNALEAAGTDAMRNFFMRLQPPAAHGARQLGVTLKDGFAETFPEFISKLKELETRIADRLRDIAKTFFNRAQGWGQQMLQGFIGSQGALFTTISNMVGEINAILKKIITSFHLTLTFSEPTQSNGSMGGGAGTGGGGGNAGGGNGNRRASGGPVIAGQSYSVSEFFKPERFTPNTNGRIDAMQPQIVTATIDEGRLVRLMIQAMAQRGMGTS